MQSHSVEILGTKIKEEMLKLNKFNYDVASYRLQNGMSVKLKALYRQMGVYQSNLEALLLSAELVNDLFQEIYSKKEDNNVLQQ